jgi:hypothetical protein
VKHGFVLTAAALIALTATAWGLLHVGSHWHYQIVDYPTYQNYGDAVTQHHEVPYRDFAVEYPPAALPVFIVPALLQGNDYRHAFQGLMFLCDLVIVFAVAGIGGIRPAALTAVAPLALGSVVLSRFDFWPTALTALALMFLLRNRSYVSAVLLGTAFAAKLWPGALVPVILIWLARTLDWRAAARWLTVVVATVSAWFLPFVVISPGGVAHSFHAQLGRPVQIESLGGALLILVHHATGSSLRVVSSFGSQNLAGSGVGAVELATTVVGVVALIAVWVLFAAGPATRQRLLLSCAAAVAALVAFGKVFSPQFMIWLIPLVLVVKGRRGLVAGVLLYAGLLLTQTWFPDHYWDLASRFALTQSNELLARDLCVVALFTVLAWPSAQHEPVGTHRSRLGALQRIGVQVD